MLPIFLNLGCGNTVNSDPQWLHHDLGQHSPGVRLIGDLQEIDASDFVVHRAAMDRFAFSGPRTDDPGQRVLFQGIHARDVLEHLPPNRIHNIMEFCWNSLAPDGLLNIQVPQHGSDNAVIDPTHYRGFHLRSFDMFDPETSMGRKSRFYGLGTWRILRAETVPGSNVNLVFTLRRTGPRA